jgi:cysteinyl-tRNA synthetase
VRSFPAYGALSGQDPSNLQQGETDVETKRDPLDFALWKSAKPGEPSWETPWGEGRPGWHLECSAMATKYLGASFDIHGGGLDLVFPHHENEQAQSRAAGDGFANFWMHNGLVTLGGDKMSKSLGNVLSVGDLLELVRPVELRYFLVAPHYRSSVEFTQELVENAATAYRRIEGFVVRARELLGTEEAEEATDLVSALPAAFIDAMNDDLGVPQALAVLHTTVRDGNAALAAGDKAGVSAHLGEVNAMLTVLGLESDAGSVTAGAAGELRAVVDGLVALALEQRTAARERKDYQAADAIRDQLAAAGIIVEDTAAGARWQLRRD